MSSRNTGIIHPSFKNDNKIEKLNDATSTNIISPKGISKKSPNKQTNSTLNGIRKRLSIMSDNKLIEGFNTVSTDEQSETTVTFHTCTASIISSYAGSTKKGYAPYNPKKRNQDALIMEHHKSTDSLLLCVFDGHGEAGDGISQYFKKYLPSALFKHQGFQRTGDINKDIENIKKALVATVSQLEKKLLKNPTIDTEFSGTTAVITVIRDGALIVGNIGDSRIIKASFSSNSTNLSVMDVSIDHKPDRADEKSRILSMGGRVFAIEYEDGIDGPQRVWLGNMDIPGLAMSRSLCDTVAHSAGVISDPEFFVYHLDKKSDKYLVLASDGLWEFMSNQQVIEFVDDSLSCEKNVENLITEANKRWMKEEKVVDDTTVILAKIG